MRQSLIQVVGIGAMLLLVGKGAEAVQAWGFDSDSEGWLVADLTQGGPYHPPLAYTSLSHSSAQGFPGGQVFRSDPGPNTFAFCMPAEALNNAQHYVGGRLEFALRSTQQDYSDEALVILASPDHTLLGDIAVPGVQWTTYSVPLTAATFRQEGGGPVNDALFADIMADLEALYIVAEYGAGTSERTHLDSVRLWGPCPTLAVPSLGAGVLVVAEEPFLQLSWTPVPGAGVYEILLLETPWGRGQSLAITSDTIWTGPASGDQVGAFRVKARCD